jgi:ParB/RepB/Spo0J family partition protein
MEQQIELHWRRLTPNPLNRLVRGVGEEDVSELAASLKEHGVIEPLVVIPRPSPIPGGEEADHMIICGEQRWRAAKSLGDDAPPLRCIVKPEMGRVEQLVIMGIENLQRNNIGAIAEARYYQALGEEIDAAAQQRAWDSGHAYEGMTHAKIVGQIVKRTGIWRDRVESRLKLLTLHPRVVELMEMGAIPIKADVALRRLPVEMQGEMADKLAGRSISGIEKAIQLVLERLEREAERVTGSTGATSSKNGKGPSSAETGPKPKKVKKEEVEAALRATCAACEAQQEMRHEIAWESIEAAGDRTCRRCDVRDIRDACGVCPLPEFLRELRNGSGNKE